jgi:DNA-binding PadR family transcriptional regulator
MPTNALANRLVLPILGLLAEHPRHAYALFTELRARYAYVAVRNATVYTLLETLVGHGLLRTRADDPERLQYRLTAEGRRVLAERVERELTDGDLADRSTFMTALAYLGILDTAAAEEALRTRGERVRTAMARLDRGLAEAAELPELHMIETHYYLDQLRHDRAWLEATSRRIHSGELRWPRPPARAR